MSQIYYCSHCGGTLASDKVSQCPHCKVWLRGVHEGSLEGLSHVQQAYAKQKAEENRWQRYVFWKKTLQPLLVRFVLPAFLLAGLAALLIFAWGALFRLFLPMVAGLSHASLRAGLAAAAVLAAPLLSFALFSIIPVVQWLDLVDWWMLVKPELLDTRTWKEHRRDIQTGLNEAVLLGIFAYGDFHSKDPRRQWFQDPNQSRSRFSLNPPWPTKKAIRYFLGIQAAIWLVGIVIFTFALGGGGLQGWLASPATRGFMIFLAATGALVFGAWFVLRLRIVLRNKSLSIVRDKKGNYLCPTCHAPFEKNSEVYDHLKWHHPDRAKKP